MDNRIKPNTIWKVKTTDGRIICKYILSVDFTHEFAFTLPVSNHPLNCFTKYNYSFQFGKFQCYIDTARIQFIDCHYFKEYVGTVSSVVKSDLNKKIIDNFTLDIDDYVSRHQKDLEKTMETLSILKTSDKSIKDLHKEQKRNTLIKTPMDETTYIKKLESFVQTETIMRTMYGQSVRVTIIPSDHVYLKGKRLILSDVCKEDLIHNLMDSESANMLSKKYNIYPSSYLRVITSKLKYNERKSKQ